MENHHHTASQATIGQLFDKAVDKVMNDQQFRSNMEQQNKSKTSWSFGQVTFDTEILN